MLLKSTLLYPTLEAQETRFLTAGWRCAHARSLWAVWADDSFLSSSERTRLDEIESFDEVYNPSLTRSRLPDWPMMPAVCFTIPRHDPRGEQKLIFVWIIVGRPCALC